MANVSLVYPLNYVEKTAIHLDGCQAKKNYAEPQIYLGGGEPNCRSASHFSAITLTSQGTAN